MDAALAWDDHDEASSEGPHALTLAPDVVEVHRNGSLAALVGAVASGLAIAYVARASGTGSALDWTLAVGMGLIGAGYLRAFVDARTPLLVADAQGVRIRLGRTWRGLPWGAVREVEHAPRRGMLRDGRLVLVARNPERAYAELDASGRRQSRLSERLYGAPFAVPLGLATRVTGADADLTGALRRLADGAAVVTEVAPAIVDSEPDQSDHEPDQPLDDDAGTPRRWRDPRPALAHGIAVVSARLPVRTRDENIDDEVDIDEVGAPIEVSPTPEPVRLLRRGRRAQVHRDDDHEHADHHAVDDEAHEAPADPEATQEPRWTARLRPIARAGEVVEPLVIDDLGIEPVDDPVVGPTLAAARTRLGLSVDQLSERTRIRPHVIESIEVDDFVPCGGDFYARGHLRTLARVLGVDVAPLLTAYDQRYADAPIDARRVFEAELATGAGGAIRGTRGGPNWSVLVAAVMALVLAWSVARLLMDTPVELQQPAPVLNGSDGVGNSIQGTARPVSVELRAVQGGARVVVRDGAGETVFDGDIAHGAVERLDVVPPVRVESSDAGAVETHVAGKNRGTLGESGSPGRGTFIVRR